MSIEALLAVATTKVAIDAIYYVTRLIRHRADLRGSTPKLLVEGLKNEPSADAALLAQDVVKAIESEKHVSLEKISPEVAAKLVGELEQLAKLRYTEGVTLSADRGDALLQELRDTSNFKPKPAWRPTTASMDPGKEAVALFGGLRKGAGKVTVNMTPAKGPVKMVTRNYV